MQELDHGQLRMIANARINLQWIRECLQDASKEEPRRNLSSRFRIAADRVLQADAYLERMIRTFGGES